MSSESDWSLSELGKEARNASRPFDFGQYSQVVFVNTGDVLAGRLLHTTISSANGLPGQAKKALRRNDILLTEIRPGNGRYAFVDFAPERFVVSTKFMVIETLGRVTPRFLYHLLTNQPALDEFQRIAESRSGTFPQITFDSIAHFPLPVPPIEEQLGLVRFLDTVQERIELLRETNATLEAIAQALFKSWFVDFDPVRAKSQGLAPAGMDEATAALFPDSFEEPALGLVPKGWSVRRIEEIAERVGMGPFGSNIKVSTFVESGTPVLNGANVQGALLEDRDFRFVTEAHAERLRNSCVRSGDIVLTHRGTLGQVALVPTGARFSEYVLSQSQFFLRCDATVMQPEWMLYFLRSPVGQHLLLSNASQVGVPSIARPSSYLKSMRLVAPPVELVNRYADAARSLHASIVSNKGTAATLATLRDTLLPRLISGQLRLPEAEAALEAA